MEVTLLEATNEPERVICKAARNDYLSEWVGDHSFEEIMAPVDGATLDEKMQRLIAKLLTRGHYGPFEHVQATFAVKGISRSCMAQITRHRHVSFDVQSMRYVSFEEMDPAPGEAVVLIPELDDPGLVGRSAAFADDYAECTDEEILHARQNVYERAVRRAFDEYTELLALGTAPENARMVLPIGTKVNLVMSMNARMLMHVADMRAAADAQWEIRELTNGVLDLAAEWCPRTFTYYDEQMKGRVNRLAP